MANTSDLCDLCDERDGLHPCNPRDARPLHAPSHSSDTPSPQQQFLREAMRELQLGRGAFAARFGATKRALDNWLLPATSNQYRDMPAMARQYIGEVLAWHRAGLVLPAQHLPSEV